MKLNCYCPDLTDEEFGRLDMRELNLTGKTFFTSKVAMVSHFPLNPEIKIYKMLKEMEKKGYRPARPLFVIFEDGLLAGRAMIEIEGEGIRGEGLVTFPRLILQAKTFAGPKYLVPKALKAFDAHLTAEDKIAGDYYFWYHSCRQCEKVKGSRTVILAKILS